MFRFFFSVAVLWTLSTSVHAQSAGADSGSWDAGTSSNTVKAPLQKIPVSPDGYTYEGLLALGHAQYMAHNYAGATDQYEKARILEPGKALAYYFIGTVHAKQNRFQEALTALRTAATVAGTKDINVHAKSLFFIAVVVERSGDLAQAKFAWADYLNSVAPNAISFPQVATERITTIENLEKEKAKYQIVRDRIANPPK